MMGFRCFAALRSPPLESPRSTVLSSDPLDFGLTSTMRGSGDGRCRENGEVDADSDGDGDLNTGWSDACADIGRSSRSFLRIRINFFLSLDLPFLLEKKDRRRFRPLSSTASPRGASSLLPLPLPLLRWSLRPLLPSALWGDRSSMAMISSRISCLPCPSSPVRGEESR